MSTFPSTGPWSHARKSVLPWRRSPPRAPAGSRRRGSRREDVPLFFSFSERQRRDYDPSRATVKDILPLLRTARVGEQRAAILRESSDEAASGIVYPMGQGLPPRVHIGRQPDEELAG